MSQTDPVGLAEGPVDESDFEKKYGLKSAMDDKKTLKDDAKDLNNVPGENERNSSAICNDGGLCSLSASFEKAFKGSWEETNAKGEVVLGAYVKLSFTVNCCCKELRILQVGRYTSEGSKKKDREIDDPSRKKRATKKTDDVDAGWFVDTNQLDVPYYSFSNRGSSECNKESKAATMWDAAGDYRRSNPKGHGKEFYTCAVCDGKVLGCVGWSYYIDNNLNVKLSLGKVTCGKPAAVGAALDRWNEVAGEKGSELTKHSVK